MNKASLVVAALVFGGFILFLNWERAHFRKILPEEIETAGTLLISGETGLREGCGTAIFRLSKATLKSIEDHGLSFFDRALKSRGHSDRYHTFEPWNKTPLPSAWVRDGGLWGGLYCAELTSPLVQKLRTAGKSKGGFYTTKPEGELVVFPDLGIVVFTYWG